MRTVILYEIILIAWIALGGLAFNEITLDTFFVAIIVSAFTASIVLFIEYCTVLITTAIKESKDE